MFSLTRSTTWSWPQTSVKRVLMSSGKYVSTPPRDSSQNRPMNWKAMKKNAKASCATYGRACQSRAGAWNSASAGEVSSTSPRMRASTAIQNTHLMARAILKRFQSEKRRWVQRSKPPNTPRVQNRLYPADRSLTKKWSCRRNSTPRSQKIHGAAIAVMIIASWNVMMPSYEAISLHTRTK